MIIQCFIPLPALSSKPECGYSHWSSGQTLTPLTFLLVLRIHTFVAHTGQTHCWSQRWVWEARRVSAPSESEVKKLQWVYFHLPRPCFRSFTFPPIHKHLQPLSLPPAHKNFSLLQQLTVTPGPSMSGTKPGVCVTCYATWDGESKRLRGKVWHPCCCGEEKEGSSLCCGEISSLQQWPCTVQSIPLSAWLVASTQLCRNKTRTRSWSLMAVPVEDCGHAAQALQLLSHPVCFPLSVLSTTTMLLHNSTSFSCNWAKVSPHDWYLAQKFLPNHCFTSIFPVLTHPGPWKSLVEYPGFSGSLLRWNAFQLGRRRYRDPLLCF